MEGSLNNLFSFHRKHIPKHPVDMLLSSSVDSPPVSANCHAHHPPRNNCFGYTSYSIVNIAPCLGGGAQQHGGAQQDGSMPQEGSMKQEDSTTQGGLSAPVCIHALTFRHIGIDTRQRGQRPACESRDDPRRFLPKCAHAYSTSTA